MYEMRIQEDDAGIDDEQEESECKDGGRQSEQDEQGFYNGVEQGQYHCHDDRSEKINDLDTREYIGQDENIHRANQYSDQPFVHGIKLRLIHKNHPARGIFLPVPAILAPKWF